MSGPHGTTEYPSYDPMYEQPHESVYGVPQPSYGDPGPQPYGVHEQQPYPGAEAAGGYAGYTGHDGSWGDDRPGPEQPDPYDRLDSYDQPFRPAQSRPPYGSPESDGAYGAYEVYDGQGTAGPYRGFEGDDGYGDGYAGYGAFEPAGPYGGPADDGPAGPAPLAPVTPVAAVPVEGRSRGHRRKPKKKGYGRAVSAGTALLLAAAGGWYAVGQEDAKPGLTAADGPGPDPVAVPDRAGAPAQTDVAAAPAADQHTAAPKADRSQARPDASQPAIAGLGPAFLARIPADTNQVVLASGEGRDTNRTTVTLWTRTAEGRWVAGESWQGHNAYRGWTTDHNEGDLRSPIGVFSLTDAGGRKADPGSKLPYDKDPLFVVSGTGFAGEPLDGSFDYVVAINYNRVAGNSPLDARRPNGSKKGGGIWIHVDHGGPTHGCISVPEEKMAELVRTLDPAAKPVIVMGDATSLAA